MSVPLGQLYLPLTQTKIIMSNMNYYKSKLNLIRVALGMDVKLAEAILEDGVTKVEAESFEAGSKIFVVSEDGERAPAPEGVHVTEDGVKVTVDAEGTITLVE